LAGSAWLLAPALAVAFVVATAYLRATRVRHVSALQGWSVGETQDSASGRLPRLVVPGNATESFEWIDQTRQMFERGEARVRHVDYENAPFGHDVRAASPYRWCLGLVAWMAHILSGRSLDACLEQAALYTDPLLALALVAGAAFFVGRRFGLIAGAVASLSLATLYPLAMAFLPGAPSDQGLTLLLGLWSILPLLGGGGGRSPHRGRDFAVAGVVGGLGLWISVSSEVPLIAGIALGGVVAALIARLDPGNAGPAPVLPWRAWALAGSITSLCAYLLEFFPSNLGSWELRAIHPIYGIAWLGAGGLLALATRWIQGGRRALRKTDILIGVVSLACLAALPAAMAMTHSSGFMDEEISAARLTRVAGGAAAKSLVDWLIQDSLSAAVGATLLPVLLFAPAVWILFRKGSGLVRRTSVALALGPAAVALGFAFLHLSWWNGVDAAAVALMVSVTAAVEGGLVPRLARWSWLGLAAVACGCGAVQDWPVSLGSHELTEPEAIGLIDRDLARWLALHAPSSDTVVLAPPNTTTALYYYGGIRGLGTLDWENREGIQASVRIVSATTPDEALGLVNRHNVSYIIIPSWDTQLDSFARMGLGQLQGSLIDGLHHWGLPVWLRPIPYLLPANGGMEGQSVFIAEVTDEQDDATLMGRMASFFIEMGNLDLAASVERALRRFPSDVGALVGRAQVQIARGEKEDFGHTVESLIPRLTGDSERNLPWDRRVDLAVVLAQARHLDQSRAELRRCLDEMDDTKLKSLGTGALYHLQVLAKVQGMRIADPKLHGLALALLPPDIRSRMGD
jgi:hypothetical protein